MTQNFEATQCNILNDDYLIRKIYDESNKQTSFDIYDTGHSIFPKGDYKNYGIDKFKLVGHYSFSVDEDELFNDFLISIKEKHIVKKNLDGYYGDFFSLNEHDDKKTINKSPYKYKFLKVHLSSEPMIAHKKMLDYVESLNRNNINYVNGVNEIYADNWAHYFIGIKQSNGKYNFPQLDALHPNEVEFDTSILMNCDPRDKDFLRSWSMLKSSR